MYDLRTIYVPTRNQTIFWDESLQAQTSLSGEVLQFINFRTGGGLPNWKALIKQGRPATTPFEGVLYRLNRNTPFSGDFKLIRVSDHSERYSENTVDSVVTAAGFQSSLVDEDLADNQAIKYILRAIRATRTQMQGMIFVAEAKKTMDMIRSPAKGLFNGVRDYIRSAGKRTRNAPKKSRKRILADTWLEYSFGWVPLASDIEDAVKAYKSLVNKKVITRLTRTGKDLSDSYFQDLWIAGQNIPVKRFTYVQSSVTVRYIVGLRAQVTGFNPTMEVFERFGFVTKQFIPTLWEITPWSFLVDYFTNIGDILDAAMTDQSDVIWINKTVRSTASTNRSVELDMQRLVSTYPGLQVLAHGSPGNWNGIKTSVKRGSGVLISIPNFRVEVPATVNKWLNLGALAVSQGSVRTQVNR